MRIKLGKNWYGHGEDEQNRVDAIMIEFTELDLKNIQNMAPSARRYASFEGEAAAMTSEEKYEWMVIGAKT